MAEMGKMRTAERRIARGLRGTTRVTGQQVRRAGGNVAAAREAVAGGDTRGARPLARLQRRFPQSRPAAARFGRSGRATTPFEAQGGGAAGRRRARRARRG